MASVLSSRMLRILIVAAVCTGCSTRADIARVNAPEVSGEILGSDEEDIYVEVEGDIRAIPRSEVTDIDHPGDGAAVVGAVLTGYGALNIAVGVPRCDEEGTAFCVGVFLPAAIGVPMTIWGLAVHYGSVGALERPYDSSEEASFDTIPAVVTADGEAQPGATVRWRF